MDVKPIVTITPQMILDNSLKRLPGYSAINDLQLLLMILTTYVGSDSTPVMVQLGPDKALKNLIAFKKISSLDDISGAHMSVMKGLAGVMAGAYARFEASTGGKFSHTDFSVFEKEFLRENAEQDALKGKAEKAINRVRIVSGQLGIANPDPVLKPAQPVAPVVEKHENVLGMFARSVRSAFIADSSVAKPTPAEPILKRKAGWTTPPVLGKRFDELDGILTIIEEYIAVLEEAKKTQAMMDVAKGTLDYMKAQGFDSAAIQAILTEFVTIAREQIAQSQEVIANIVPEFNEIKDTVSAVTDVKALVDAVKAYFA